MKFLRDVLICIIGVCALATLGSCKSVVGPTPPPNTPGFVSCSDANLHVAIVNLLPAVENALAGGSWEADLLALVASVGGPLAVGEVNCGVEWVLSKAQRMADAPTYDPLEATKADRARQWLKKYPAPVAP